MKPVAFKYGKGKPATGLRGIQPKLSVNRPGDRFEREADEMAAKVVQQLPQHDTGIIAQSLGRIKPNIKNKGSQDQLMRKAAGGSSMVAPSGTQLGSSNGSPMPTGVRSFMENAFSRDFSTVRLHTDDEAAGMSRGIGAKAFTHGNDIYFNQGQFAPETLDGKKLLAHELTHVVQQRETTTTPDLQRTVELRPPGRGEASAFGRVQELIDRLNAQSAAIQYSLEGNILVYNIIDEGAMTHFDQQMQAFIDRQQVVRMRLITSEGRGRPNSGATFEQIFIDFFDAGYVDLDDLLATDNLSFQTNMLHILAERFATRNYNRRIGTTFSDAEFRRSHAAGLEAEAANFRSIFNDPSIRFSFNERVGRRFMVVFRSAAEGYQIFVLFRSAAASIAQSEVRVRTRGGQWFSGEEFQQRRAEGAPVVQPKLFMNKPGDQQEKEADALAEKVVQHPQPKRVAKELPKKLASKGLAAPPAVAATLRSSKGSGAPLPENTRTDMEYAFHTDFSAVRIHTDHRAIEMSQDIQAKAFTYGRDIYFNSSQFAPWTVDGKQLLAHELVHVIQQQGVPNQTSMIQRIAEKAAPEQKTEEKYFEGANGIIDARESGLISGKERKVMKMLLKEVKVASQKYAEVQEYGTISIRKGERPSNQAILWRKDKDKFSKKVSDKIKEKGKPASKIENEVVYYFFKLKKSRQQYVIGTLDQILEAITIPTWNKEGEMRKFHVDHRKEYQFGGEHAPKNFWLWQDTANMSAGSLLDKEIVRRIAALIQEAIDDDKIWKVPKGKDEKRFVRETAEKAKKDFELTIVNIVPGLGPIKGKPDEHFNWPQIFEQGLPLEGLTPMTEREIDNLSGTKTELSIMIGNRASRKPRRVNNRLNKIIYNWLKGLDLLEVTDYNPDALAGEQYAVLEGYLFRHQQKKNLIKISGMRIPVVKVPGVPFFGKVEGRLSQYILNTVEVPGMSLINVEAAYIDDDSEAVTLAGKVVPSLSFLKNADIDILYSGNDVSLQKTFDLTALKDNVPKPFHLTDGEITVFVSLETGLGVNGRLDFEIERVGTGFIEGAGSKKGFVLKGDFDFEKGLFDDSHIEVGYQKTAEDESGTFSFKGWAAKKASKENKAIKYARIEVSYENGILTAKGEAETSLPAIPKGSIQVITGGPVTSVEADFTVGDAIPGVTGGNLHFLFMKMEDGSFQIMASSTIQTKFPGIPMVALKGFYKSDGTFLFEGDALLKKGDRFTGTVHFGITNQEVDEKGELTGKKGDQLLAFGSGEVFFRMNKWLGGKINAIITPDTPDPRVVLGGELRPDPLLPITKEPYKVEKTLGSFSLPKFTLFGIPRVAEIYVTASGYLLFFASLGPVYLKGAFLKFKDLDIEHPELTVITGGGSLDIPGEAGVTLGAKIEAGLGILVVNVEVGLDGSISFVIKGNAGLEIGFEWSLDKGLRLKESTAYLKAKSELVAKLAGTVEVNLDLLLTTINLFRRKWGLAEKRWPLGLDLDLSFPLAFAGDGDNFQLPDVNKITNPEPKFDPEIVKKATVEEPPDVSTAPGKEEARRRVRILPADATIPFNFYSGIFERYNYIKGLKKKYPTQDWSYLDAELPNLDARDLQALRGKIFEVPALLGRSATDMRLFVLDEFKEKHLYLRPNEVADLRSQIFETGRKEKEA